MTGITGSAVAARIRADPGVIHRSTAGRLMCRKRPDRQFTPHRRFSGANLTIPVGLPTHTFGVFAKSPMFLHAILTSLAKIVSRTFFINTHQKVACFCMIAKFYKKNLVACGMLFSWASTRAHTSDLVLDQEYKTVALVCRAAGCDAFQSHLLWDVRSKCVSTATNS